MKKPRLKKPTTFSDPVLFRITPDMKTKLRVLAAQKGVSMSDYVRELVGQHITTRTGKVAS